ncbi:MAG TPA: hypothetical protein VFF27_01020 [Bacteroidia bacterium]|nr:hypothetical protein [Bacteroidia bacterium]
MKKILSLIMGITLTTVAIAQNPYLDYKYAWKINNLTMLSNNRYPVYVSTPYAIPAFRGAIFNNYVQWLHPTFAFDWQSKRKNTHEIELIDLIVGRSNINYFNYSTSSGSQTVSDKTRQTSISLRYEYMINFCTNKESRWVPSLGFSFNPYYRSFNSIVSDPLTTHSNLQTAGIRLSFNPKITYYFSKHFFVTAGIGLTMLDYSFSNYTTGPANQIGQQRVRTLHNFKGVRELIEFRVGIGYKF